MNKEATRRVGWQDKHIFYTSELILGINLFKTVIKLSPDEEVLEQLPYIFEQQKILLSGKVLFSRKKT